MGEVFPWQTGEEFLDYRVEPSGQVFADVVAAGRFPSPRPRAGAGEHGAQVPEDGLRHPVGQGRAVLVHPRRSRLRSASLLPGVATVHRRVSRCRCSSGFPTTSTTAPVSATSPEFRRRSKDPTLYLAAADATSLGVGEGDWARVTTATGAMVGRVFIRSTMPDGLVRVPPRLVEAGVAPGTGEHVGHVGLLRRPAHIRRRPRVHRLGAGHPPVQGRPPAGSRGCPTTRWPGWRPSTDRPSTCPRARRGTKTRPVKLPEFLDEHEMSFDVEFEAVELSIYGRITL